MDIVESIERYLAGSPVAKGEREWVGLTDEEMDYWIDSNSTKKGLCRAIGKALKGKNT